MQGTCFCEAVRFEISLNAIEAYHCHCSICRKCTGSKCNTAAVIPAHSFKWTSPTDTVKTFQKNGKGFRHDFCSQCGCTVPNYYQENKVWLPVGLLDDSSRIEVVKHIFVGSKASWDSITDSLKQYDNYI